MDLGRKYLFAILTMLLYLILDQFPRIPLNTTIENKYFGVFNKILDRTFNVTSEKFSIQLQYPLPQTHWQTYGDWFHRDMRCRDGWDVGIYGSLCERAQCAEPLYPFASFASWAPWSHLLIDMRRSLFWFPHERPIIFLEIKPPSHVGCLLSSRIAADDWMSHIPQPLRLYPITQTARH